MFLFIMQIIICFISIILFSVLSRLGFVGSTNNIPELVFFSIFLLINNAITIAICFMKNAYRLMRDSTLMTVIYGIMTQFAVVVISCSYFVKYHNIMIEFVCLALVNVMLIVSAINCFITNAKDKDKHV